MVKRLVNESLDEFVNEQLTVQDAILQNAIGTLPPKAYKKQGNKRVIKLKELWDRARVLGYNRHRDFDNFQEYLLDHMDELKLAGRISVPHDFREKMREKRAHQILDTYSDRKTTEEQARPNDLVIRSYMGDGPVYFYRPEGMSQKEVNQLKGAYSVLSDVNYYDARPIRYKNWIKLSDERKQQTYRDDDEFYIS